MSRVLNCKVCSQPTEVDVPSDFDEKDLAQVVVCNDCLDIVTAAALSPYGLN